MNAVRAYFEWMPIRQVDMDDNLRIWRSFSLGKLVDLVSDYLQTIRIQHLLAYSVMLTFP